MNNRGKRIKYYEGLRGIASIQVVLNHLTCVFLPAFYYYNSDNTLFEQFWINSPFNALNNGNIAVQFFLLLTGFFATQKAYRANFLGGGDIPIVEFLKSISKKYTRLLKIVVPAIFLAWFLMECGMMFHLQFFEIKPELDFVSSYNNFIPSIDGAIFDAFVGTFIDSSKYVGPLWTIKREFWGYIIVLFVASILVKYPKLSKWLFLALAIMFLRVDRYITTVLFGAFVYDCQYYKDKDTSIAGCIVKRVLENRISLVVIAIAGIYLVCCNNSFTGMWKVMQYVGINKNIVRSIGATVIMLVIPYFPGVQKVLSSRPLVLLGTVSPYTYAFHWQIILSVGCWIYCKGYTSISDAVLITMVFISSLLLSIGVAFAYLTVERKIFSCINLKRK